MCYIICSTKVLILAYDHNKDHLLEWAETILGSDYKNYVDGMAFHCKSPPSLIRNDVENYSLNKSACTVCITLHYSSLSGFSPILYFYVCNVIFLLCYLGYGGNDRVTDGTYGYDALNATHHLAPDKILLASEGCNCPGVNIDDWLRAERLAHDVMFDLQNYAQGWIDWNLLVHYHSFGILIL